MSEAKPPNKWRIIRMSSIVNSLNGRCNLYIKEKISIINFKEWNDLVLKCRHECKFKLSRLGATKAPTLDGDIEAGWFLLELIAFFSVIHNIIWRGDLYRGGDSWKLLYYFKMSVFNFRVVNFPWQFWGLIKGTWWLPKVFFYYFLKKFTFISFYFFFILF